MKVQKLNETHTSENKSSTHKWWLGSFIFFSLACAAAYVLLKIHFFDLLGKSRITLQKIFLAGFIGFVVLIISKVIERIIISKSETRFSRYNGIRMLRLLTTLIIAGIFISFVFHNWYTAAVSLGLISLVLGFALQTPISSFIGWIYIIIRNPYRVGDRIQITDFTGDVVEISYLDTTLSEFAGDYLTNDIPSGRLIRFPNSLVFQNAVYNYSWDQFFFIWNEIPFHIAYESDFQFAEETLKNVTKEILGKEMPEHVKQLQDKIKDTPLEKLELKEYPYITFRTNANTWVEVTVSYLVSPRKASMVRSAILRKAIGELLKQPDKVLFPKGNSR